MPTKAKNPSSKKTAPIRVDLLTGDVVKKKTPTKKATKAHSDRQKAIDAGLQPESVAGIDAQIAAAVNPDAAWNAKPDVPATRIDTRMAKAIQDRVVIFILTIRGPGNERSIRDKTMLNTDADKRRLRVTKKLFDCKEYKTIGYSIDPSIRAYIKRIALPSPFKEGIYALPIDLLPKCDEQMEQFALQRNEAVQQLKNVFQAEKERAKEMLGSLYRESDYDIDFNSAYKLEWQYVTIGAPSAVSSINGKLYTREQERIQAQWTEAVDDMRAALRVGLAELVDDMVKRLENSRTKDGEDKRVKPSNLLKRFDEFLANFHARNVTGDDGLEKLAEQARAVLKGVNTNALVKSLDLRDQVAQGFKKVQTTLNSLELESKNRRRFSFDGE